MRWWLILSGVTVMSIRLWFWWRRVRYADDRWPVSTVWRRQQQQLDDRIEFHGPTLKKPINKVINEHAWYQTQKLRKPS